MRIGLITAEYPPRQGGVGDFTRELARALAELGNAVTVITATAVPAPPADPPISVRPIVASWGRAGWRTLAEAARQLDLDVLNIQYEPAAYAMQIGINLFPWWYGRQSNRVPVVTTFHDLLVPYLFPKAGPLRWKIVEFLARRSDAVIVTNADDRLTLSQCKPPVSHVHVVPIGSNIPAAAPAGFDRRRERARWGAGENDWLAAYFGFLSMSKGGLTLMRAIGLLVHDGLPVRLVLIGGRTGSSDPSNARYAAEVDDAIRAHGLSDRVRSTGYVEPAEVTAALLASDVVVLPYADGVSLRRGSLMAALAHGKAIVTTRPKVPVPGIADGESCLLVAAEDAGGLADGIRRLMAEPGLRVRLESGAREVSRQFTWESIATRTVAVYAGVRR